MTEAERVRSDNQSEEERWHYNALWRRVREAIYRAVNAVFKLHSPDVIEKIEDVLGRAKCDRHHKEETEQCHDEANETQ